MLQALFTLVSELLRVFQPLFLRPSKQIGKVVNIYDAMHYILENSNVERILILKSHNGGGLIKPDTPLYVTCLYEDYTNPLESVKSFYQKMEVDEQYIRMLRDLSQAKILKRRTENLDDGLLKNAFVKDGILYSEMQYLGQDRRNLYFCSLVTTQSTDFERATDRTAIQVSVSGIKNNIR